MQIPSHLSSSILTGVGVVVFYYALYALAYRTFRAAQFFLNFQSDPIRHEFLSYVVSMVNSFLQSLVLITAYYAFVSDDPSFTTYARFWVTFFFSYNVYDTFSCCRYRFHVFRSEPGLIVHHALVMSALASAFMATAQVQFFFVVAGLVEINSVFLHLRTLLKMCAPAAQRLRWPVDFFQIVTFVVFRYSTGAYVLYLAYALPPPITNRFYQFGTFVYLVINTVIAYRLTLEYAEEFRPWLFGRGAGLARKLMGRASHQSQQQHTESHHMGDAGMGVDGATLCVVRGVEHQA